MQRVTHAHILRKCTAHTGPSQSESDDAGLAAIECAVPFSQDTEDTMRLNNFATLQRGDRIKVKMYRADSQVMTVTGEPFESNTLVPVIDEAGKQYSVYFRDVLKFEYPKDQF